MGLPRGWFRVLSGTCSQGENPTMSPEAVLSALVRACALGAKLRLSCATLLCFYQTLCGFPLRCCPVTGKQGHGGAWPMQGEGGTVTPGLSRAAWEEGTSLCGVTDKLPTEGIDLGFRMWRMGGAWRALVKVLLVFVGRRMEFAVDFIRKKIST